MKTRFIIMVLLTLLLTACIRNKAPTNQGSWDNSTWNSTAWQ